MKLIRDYYLNEDVVAVAHDLIGKILVTNFEDGVTSGLITETEAYAGIHDKASHAWGGRRTERTRVMYSEGGVAYVYLCYGIHSLFNIVTGPEGMPHAILVRGVKACKGNEIVHQRLGGKLMKSGLVSGPGRITKALGIKIPHTGIDLCADQIWIEEKLTASETFHVISTPRIGIDYAAEDALLPYRFVMVEKQ